MANGNVLSSLVNKKPKGIFAIMDQQQQQSQFGNLTNQQQLDSLLAGGNAPTGFTSGSIFTTLFQGKTNTKAIGDTLKQLGFRNFVQQIEEIAFLDTDPEARKARTVSLRDLRVDPIGKNNLR